MQEQLERQLKVASDTSYSQMRDTTIVSLGTAGKPLIFHRILRSISSVLSQYSIYFVAKGFALQCYLFPSFVFHAFEYLAWLNSENRIALEYGEVPSKQ